MILNRKIRIVSLSHSSTLHKSTSLVVVDFCSVSFTVGDALFSYGVSPKLAQFFCWKKKGKRLRKLLYHACFGLY